MALALADAPDKQVIRYNPVPTIQSFHLHPGQMRGIVGPVGSGKTTGATWDICRFLPFYLAKAWGYKKTKWVIVRNTYDELIDTTQATVFEWFDWGRYRVQRKIYNLYHQDEGGFEVEILFRSCDNPKDVKKFKSLEVTGYWIDESIEVAETIKKMLKNRIGRYPKTEQILQWYKAKFGHVPKDWWDKEEQEYRIPAPRFGIETTNPPDVEHDTYHQFHWLTDVPGPMAEKAPLKNHYGFWQPPRENERNLRKGYYDDLIADYQDSPDWLEMYVQGKPGILVTGKLLYNNFMRKHHVSLVPLIWTKGLPLYRGWDNSGNVPAAVVVGCPSPRRIHVFREFFHDRMGIVDFTKYVVNQCNMLFPGAEFVDYADPAGENTFSNKKGGFTSNSILMAENGVEAEASEQNPDARYNAVDDQLAIIEGMLIDPSCIRLINGFLGGYHRQEIGQGTGIYAENPVKNRFSHPHDALQYVMVRLVANKKRKKKDGNWKRKNRSAMAI